jgi:hypothetical protein
MIPLGESIVVACLVVRLQSMLTLLISKIWKNSILVLSLDSERNPIGF